MIQKINLKTLAFLCNWNLFFFFHSRVCLLLHMRCISCRLSLRSQRHLCCSDKKLTKNKTKTIWWLLKALPSKQMVVNWNGCSWSNLKSFYSFYCVFGIKFYFGISNRNQSWILLYMCHVIIELLVVNLFLMPKCALCSFLCENVVYQCISKFYIFRCLERMENFSPGWSAVFWSEKSLIKSEL